MSPKAKKFWTVLGVIFGAAVVYLIIRAVTKGVATVKAELATLVGWANAPAQIVTGAAGYVADTVAGAASLPSMGNQSATLDNQIRSLNQSDYAPGGKIYNNIASTRGVPAAEAAWAQVQEDLANQETQTAAWWQFWK